MLRLTRRGTDDGAAAIVVALVVCLTLIPLSLFLVDVGSFYGERRALQNAADSGVLAVVSTAASRANNNQAPLTAAAADSLAETMTTQNRVRGAGTAAVYDTAQVLGPTPPGQITNGNAYYDCTYPAPTGRYVEVHTTSTTTAGGDWPNFFGSGKTLYSCARAQIGNLAYLGGGFPVTMSICEWNAATSNGTRYAPAPPYDAFPPPVSPDPAVYQKTVELQSGQQSTDPNDPGCMRGPANQFVPGGFGWLSGPGCTATINPSTGWAGSGTGASEEPECKNEIHRLWQARQPVVLPVHDVSRSNGSNGEFHVVGYAAFVITGYDLASAGKEKSWLTNQFPSCPGPGNSGKCVTGFFTQALSSSPGSIGGGSFGATTYNLVP